MFQWECLPIHPVEHLQGHINVGREEQAHNLRSSSSQRCSMQLRSLLCTGQSNFSTLNPSNHVFMDLAGTEKDIFQTLPTKLEA